MVSQISARLMNRYSSSSDNSNTTGSSNNINNTRPSFSAVVHRRNATGTVVSEKSTTASAGYAADMESSLGDNASVDASAAAPFYVGVNRKHESSGVIDSRSPKRRQILEMTYLASRVTIELARAKKAAPVMRKNPLVNHITSSSLDSAFLTPKSPSNGLFGQDYSTSLGDIMQACRSFYTIPAESLLIKEVSTLSDSSTSSISNSDSDEASPNDGEPALVTMKEALSISKEARVVTLASSPYVVVHINAAFTRATGLSSIAALGKPFHELLKESSFIAKPQSLNNMHGTSLTMKTNATPYKVSVSPVGPDQESATHFSLELESSKVQSQDFQVSRPLPAARQAFAIVA